jgi:hypothetical protein
MHKFGRLTIVLASLVLFVVCLTQDGFYIEGPNPRAWASALYLFLLGWLGLLSGTIAWFANPLLWIAGMMVITLGSGLALLGLVRDARAENA